MDNGLRLIVGGLVLLIAGALLPWLMVLEYLASTLFLNIVTIAAQVAGLFMGFIGIGMHMAGKR